MYEHYKEASLPITYRRREIECIITPLAMQRSVRVVGLTGMGKSNLLRFLVSHPELLENNPDLSDSSICFLHVDCNRLSPVNPLSFYRECHFLLQTDQVAAAPSDERLSYRQLELALRKLDQQTLIILVVDRADYLYKEVGREFYSQLRNLRDEARAGRMMFIFGSQRPLGDLYELEKLFSDTCWVGPLAEADRAEFFTRHQRRLNVQIGEDLQQILWRLTGAHPGFLKNGMDWIKRRGVDNTPDDETHLTQELLGYKPIQKYCRGLWENLAEVEQDTLLNLGSTPSTAKPIHQLKQSGVIIDDPDELRVFSPLWRMYLARHIWPEQVVKPMQVQMDAATRRVVLQWRGKTAETVITRKLVFDLLQVLSSDPNKIYSKDELISMIYEGEKAQEVLEDALFQLITALRKSLDPLVKRLCPAMTTSCIQNVRGVGYTLIVDLPVKSPKDVKSDPL
jgi:DNA-binding winged helix-turn-helix (wHTH) protein